MYLIFSLYGMICNLGTRCILFLELQHLLWCHCSFYLIESKLNKNEPGILIMLARDVVEAARRFLLCKT